MVIGERENGAKCRLMLGYLEWSGTPEFRPTGDPGTIYHPFCIAGPFLLTEYQLDEYKLYLVKARPSPEDLQVVRVGPGVYEVRPSGALRTLPAEVVGRDVDVERVDGAFRVRKSWLGEESQLRYVTLGPFFVVRGN